MYETLLTIREAIKGFLKNIWWNVAVLVLMVMSYFAYSVFFVANENINHISESLNEEMVVKVNLVDGLTNLGEIIKGIENMDSVVSVKYKDKAQVLAETKKEMGEDAQILSKFENEQIFPATLTVTLETPEKIKDFVLKIEKENFVKDVYYGEKYLDGFLNVTNKFKKFGMIAALMGISLVVIGIIFIIKMNVEQRKEEIYVKSLIGASGYVIRMPFIIETIIIGFLAYVIVFLGFTFIYDEMIEIMKAKNILLHSGEYMIDYGISLLLVSLFVTLLGSIYATAKHVRKI